MFSAGLPPPYLEVPAGYATGAARRTTAAVQEASAPAARVRFAPPEDEAGEPVPHVRPMAPAGVSRTRKSTWRSRLHCFGDKHCVRERDINAARLQERDAVPFHEFLWNNPHIYAPRRPIVSPNSAENHTADAAGGGVVETRLPRAAVPRPRKVGLGLGCFGKSCVKERDAGAGGLGLAGGLKERDAMLYNELFRNNPYIIAPRKKPTTEAIGVGAVQTPTPSAPLARVQLAVGQLPRPKVSGPRKGSWWEGMGCFGGSCSRQVSEHDSVNDDSEIRKRLLHPKVSRPQESVWRNCFGTSCVRDRDAGMAGLQERAAEPQVFHPDAVGDHVGRPQYMTYSIDSATAVQTRPSKRVRFAKVRETMPTMPTMPTIPTIPMRPSRPREAGSWKKLGCFGKSCVKERDGGVGGLQKRAAEPRVFHPDAVGDRVGRPEYTVGSMVSGAVQTPLSFNPYEIPRAPVVSRPRKSTWRSRLNCFGKSCVRERDADVAGLQEREAEPAALPKGDAEPEHYYPSKPDGAAALARTTVTVPRLAAGATPPPSRPRQHYSPPSRPKQYYVPSSSSAAEGRRYPLLPPAEEGYPYDKRDVDDGSTGLRERDAHPSRHAYENTVGNHPLPPNRNVEAEAKHRAAHPDEPASTTTTTRWPAAAAGPQGTPAAQVDWGYGHEFSFQKRDANPHAKHATHLYRPGTVLPSTTTHYPAARARQTPQLLPLAQEFPYEGPFWKRNADPINTSHFYPANDPYPHPVLPLPSTASTSTSIHLATGSTARQTPRPASTPYLSPHVRLDWKRDADASSLLQERELHAFRRETRHGGMRKYKRADKPNPFNNGPGRPSPITPSPVPGDQPRILANTVQYDLSPETNPPNTPISPLPFHLPGTPNNTPVNVPTSPRAVPGSRSPDHFPAVSPQTSLGDIPGHSPLGLPGGSPRSSTHGSARGGGLPPGHPYLNGPGAPLTGDMGGTSHFVEGAGLWGESGVRPAGVRAQSLPPAGARSGRGGGRGVGAPGSAPGTGVLGSGRGAGRGVGRGAGRGLGSGRGRGRTTTPRSGSEPATPGSTPSAGGRGTARTGGGRGRGGKDEKDKPKAAGPAEGSPYYQSNPSYAPEWRRAGGGKWY